MIRTVWRDLLDWLSPRCVYLVRYELYHPETIISEPRYFRTERQARWYVEQRTQLDQFVHNGAADLKLIKIPFHDY